MNKLFLFFIIVVVSGAGLVAVWIFRQEKFSKNIIDLEISGPREAVMGQEIEYQIRYSNIGRIVLENARLVFSMPENSLTEDGKIRISKDLPDINPGQETTIRIKTRLLGREGELKKSNAVISFTPKDLTAKYEQSANFSTLITQVPIVLDIEMPEKAQKGGELKFSVKYSSDIDYPLENISLKIAQAEGFVFKSSDVKSLDNAEWKLATVNKGDKGSVNISGVVGKNVEQFIDFTAQIGMRTGGDFIIIKEAKNRVQAESPPLSVLQSAIDGDTENTYVISWEIANDDAEEIKNVEVRTVLPGNINFAGKVMPEDESANLLYNPATREVVWRAGDILSGTGINGDPFALYFQVGLIPDSVQNGTVELIGPAEISGRSLDGRALSSVSDGVIK